MNLHLFRLHLRRGLTPLLAGALIMLVLLIDLAAELPLSVGLATEARGALLRGLRRSDQWLGLLALLVPAAVLRALAAWRQLEERERLWLVTSPLSKRRVCLSTWAGAWSASLILLVVGAGLCEWSAGHVGEQARWRLRGALEMHDLQRKGDEGLLRWTSPIAARASDGLARFSVGLYGLEDQAQVFELSSFDADGLRHDQATVQPALRSTLEVGLPAAGGEIAFEFRARGARGSLLLHAPEFDEFVPASAFDSVLAILARVALLLAVVEALVLGLSAWFSATTVLLYVVGGYSLLWLEGERLAQGSWAAWIPASDLPGALTWIADGRAPARLPLSSLAGAALLVLLGLGLLQLKLGQWRRGR